MTTEPQPIPDMSSSDPGREARLKHLELVQALISRMSQSSFAIKGWAVTLCSALLALSAKDANQRFSLLAIYPAIVFWCLDAYYLSIERRYRELYERAAAALGNGLSLEAGMSTGKGAWTSAMMAPAVWPLYMSIIFLSVLIAAAAH